MELFAYLDPGTGSLVLQAIIGVIAATSFYFRDKIGRAFGWVKGLFSKKNKDSE